MGYDDSIFEDGDGDADASVGGGDVETGAADAGTSAAAEAGAVEPALDVGAAGGDADHLDDGKDEAASKAATTDGQEWDRQVVSLEKLDWWGSVPDGGKATIKRGLEDTFKGWQRTFNAKLEGVAKDRKAVEAEQSQLATTRQEIADLEQGYLRVLSGEDDPVASRDEKIATLTAEVESLKAGGRQALAGDAEAAIGKARELWDREKTTLAGERDTAVAELGKFTTSIEEAYREHLAGWVAEHAPDLTEDGKETGLELWLNLHTAGNSVEDALKMVRAKFPAPAVVAEPVPDAIALANMGGDRTMKRQLGAGGEDPFERARLETTEIAQWPRG